MEGRGDSGMGRGGIVGNNLAACMELEADVDKRAKGISGEIEAGAVEGSDTPNSEKVPNKQVGVARVIEQTTKEGKGTKQHWLGSDNRSGLRLVVRRHR